MAEQNNELLLQNHQSCPTSSTSIPEVNVASFSGSGRWRGRGCGQNNYQSQEGHINTTKKITRSGLTI